MRQILIAALAAASFGVLSGCAENGPAHGESVTSQIQSMPADQRFQMIKQNTGMSLPMKDKAIDNLPVPDDQKAKWKEEIRGAAPAADPGAARGGAAPSAGTGQ
jgi:hypothetical protein